MSTDWAADVKKYVPNADDAAITGIIHHCGIALHSRDASLVSFNDPVEVGRVRDSFLKKKLGLTLPDDELNAAIAAVGERMHGVSFRNRVTVYYLLAEHYGLLGLFTKGHVAAGAAGTAARGVAAEASALASGAAQIADLAKGAGAARSATGAPRAESPMGALATVDSGARSGREWMGFALVALAVVVLLFILRGCQASDTAAPAASAPAADSAAMSAPAPQPAPVAAAAPAEGTVAIPEGAGVTTETRDGKPVVKVYFATGKSEVVPDFAAAAVALKGYLGAHAGSALAVSGFADKTGNATANAALSKKRAQAVRDELVKAGVDAGAISLAKPAEAVASTGGANANARRVEVSIQ